MFPERFILSMVLLSLEPIRIGVIEFFTRVLTVVVCSKANVLPVKRFFPATSNSEEGVLLNGRVSGVGACVVGVCIVGARVVVGSGTWIVVVSTKSSSVRQSSNQKQEE